MATRRERVLLELEDRFTAPMAKAAAATALLDRQLDSLSGRAVRTHRTLPAAERDVASLGRTSERAGRQIDRLSGRMQIFAEIAAMLGPALVPLGGATIPVLAGLTNQLGFAAIAGGTALVAFQGVGDALKALKDYELDPTAESFAKVREAMNELGPAGRDFVMQLRSMAPLMQELQSAAQAGLFPGLTSGLRALATRAPEIERIFTVVSRALGDLMDEAGRGLAGGSFDEFFASIEREARPALMDLGHALGDVTVGLTEMWQAFLPMSMSFGAGMARAAAGFREWATALEGSEGFENFLDYIRETGPQVRDFLGSLGSMFVQITQAVAPLGGPVLEILTAIADAIANIADSDLGTPIFAGLAALSAYNRVLAITASLQASAFGPAAVTGRIKQTRTSLAGLTADVKTMGTTWLTAGAMSQREAARMSAASSRVSGALKGVAKGAGVLGGVALLTSGMADKLHVANTATLALAGSMAGPWGTALGAGVGALMDFTQAQSNARAAAADMASTLNEQTGAITNNTREKVYAALASDGVIDRAKQLGLSLDQVTDAALGNSDALALVTAEIDTYVRSFDGDDVVQRRAYEFAKKVTDGIHGQSDALRDARAAWRDHGEAMDITTTKATAFGDAIFRMSERVNEARQSARKTAKEFMAFGDTLDDTEVSLGKWISELEKQARALTEFGRNAQTAADKGLRRGLIKALQEAGPAGALRMRELANASEAEIRRANRAWAAGRTAIKDYVNTLGGIPKIWITNLKIGGLTEAERALIRIRTQVLSIPRRWSTTYYVNQVNAVNKRAAGGRDGDPSTPFASGGFTGNFDPRQPVGVVHGGEFVFDAVSTARAGVENLYAMQRRLRGYAGGGAVEDRKRKALTVKEWRDIARGFDLSGDMSQRDVAKEISAFERAVRRAGGGVSASFGDLRVEAFRVRDALDASGRAVDREAAKREALLSKQSSLSDSVSSGLLSNPFEKLSGISPWLSAGDRKALAQSSIFGSLTGDIAKTKQFASLSDKLTAAGLSGDALASVQAEGLDAVSALAGMGAADIRKYQALFDQRQKLVSQTAAKAGDQAYGRLLEIQAAQLAETRADRHAWNQRLKRLENAFENSVTKVGTKFAKDINQTAAGAVRGKKK